MREVLVRLNERMVMRACLSLCVQRPFQTLDTSFRLGGCVAIQAPSSRQQAGCFPCFLSFASPSVPPATVCIVAQRLVRIPPRYSGPIGLLA